MSVEVQIDRMSGGWIGMQLKGLIQRERGSAICIRPSGNRRCLFSRVNRFQSIPFVPGRVETNGEGRMIYTQQCNEVQDIPELAGLLSIVVLSFAGHRSGEDGIMTQRHAAIGWAP